MTITLIVLGVVAIAIAIIVTIGRKRTSSTSHPDVAHFEELHDASGPHGMLRGTDGAHMMAANRSIALASKRVDPRAAR